VAVGAHHVTFRDFSFDEFKASTIGCELANVGDFGDTWAVVEVHYTGRINSGTIRAGLRFGENNKVSGTLTALRLPYALCALVSWV